MIRNSVVGYVAVVILASAGIAGCRTGELNEASRTAPTMLMPSSMARVGTIDERFQSYNVEMLEVTGGKFWRPYGPELAALLVINNDQPFWRCQVRTTTLAAHPDIPCEINTFP